MRRSWRLQVRPSNSEQLRGYWEIIAPLTSCSHNVQNSVDDFGRDQWYESLSFFITALTASLCAIPILWNFTVSGTPLRKLTITATLQIQEFLFTPISVESTSPGKDLLLGWRTFPLRTFPKASFDAEVFGIGLAAALHTVIVCELFGRISFRKNWKTRFSFSLLGGFVLHQCCNIFNDRHPTAGWQHAITQSSA